MTRPPGARSEALQARYARAVKQRFSPEERVASTRALGPASEGAPTLDGEQRAPVPAALSLPSVCRERQVDEAELVAQAEVAIAFLESVRERRALLAVLSDVQRARLLRAAGEVARPDPWAKRELVRAAAKRHREAQRVADEQLLARTGIRKKRQDAVFVTPPLGAPPVARGVDIDRALAPSEPAESIERADDPGASVREERSCYVCKRKFRTLHFFYDAMCPSCGDLNWQKRTQTADLCGRVALITGARVKIGYQAAIMLLRAGARVVLTTRFPRDAAARYASEADFPAWRDRLSIYGLDLRHTPSVEAFAAHLDRTLGRLDFIINNACQTVRRPSGFYEHLLHREQREFAQLPSAEQALLAGYEELRRSSLVHPSARFDRGKMRSLSESGEANTVGVPAAAHAAGLVDSARLSQLTLLEEDQNRGAQLFPSGQLDADLQQVDLRAKNSWRLSLCDVSAVELLEVQLVNAVAPFLLNGRLKALMLRTPERDKHIVNVSAMEGQFYRSFKTDKHPHTNMAKAALNMMTRTSAADYVRDGIHMNSVDTGWVTDEDAAEIAAKKTREQGFHPPLDIVDGAARIVDPIFVGFNSGAHTWGAFLKDYAPTDW
jgi:NAD(P)-dependent dehydrogenase (short-subunit alcohol dehydrogenase family)